MFHRCWNHIQKQRPPNSICTHMSSSLNNGLPIWQYQEGERNSESRRCHLLWVELRWCLDTTYLKFPSQKMVSCFPDWGLFGSRDIESPFFDLWVTIFHLSTLFRHYSLSFSILFPYLVALYLLTSLLVRFLNFPTLSSCCFAFFGLEENWRSRFCSFVAYNFIWLISSWQKKLITLPLFWECDILLQEYCFWIEYNCFRCWFELIINEILCPNAFYFVFGYFSGLIFQV